MSGHSKWATTKRAKAVTDAKRSAAFTKFANLIAIAAREKGSDPTTNFALRMAIDKARGVNMPKDNIERAIKRGTGELGGNAIEELYYEGIGPAQSQFIIKSVTDSRNRSAANIRLLFTKSGGSMGNVMWNFDHKGVIRVTKEELTLKKIASEDLELEMIDLGADDIQADDGGVTVVMPMSELQKIKASFDEKGVNVESAEIEYVPKETVSLAESEQEKFDRFIDILDESEDVSDYYTNVN
jgi:YebC/PmpR family DNA-binding regulatory protein